MVLLIKLFFTLLAETIMLFASFSEVVFGNNEQSFDLNTIVNHNEQSTEGKVVEKSILKNKSKFLIHLEINL